ncbi:MAG: DUF6616 family protein [Bacteroidota bacterium]
MHYFIELWNPTQLWRSLPTADRQDYIEQVAAATASLVDQGVEILTWSVNASEVSQRASYQYFAIWKFPTLELAQAFQDTVAGAGWYRYFDQLNLLGEQDSAQNILQALAA